MLTVIIERAVKPAIPLCFGKIVDILEKQVGSAAPQSQPPSFWPYLLAYVGLLFLTRKGGFGTLREVSASYSLRMKYTDHIVEAHVDACFAILGQRYAFSLICGDSMLISCS